MSATTSQRLVDWQMRRSDAATAWRSVRLPHDAMLTAPRGSHAAGGADTGWFEGGDYEYRTTWAAPPRSEVARTATLFFEGVQGDSTVFVNGSQAGIVRSGYAEVELSIDSHVHWEASNEIAVHVAHSAQPSERWYPGSGLYRSVHVIIRPRAHFARDAVRLHTRELTSQSATVEIAVALTDAPSEVLVTAELRDAEGVAAVGSLGAAAGTIELQVPRPRAWSADSPHRYHLTVRAAGPDGVLDQHAEQVGLRTVSVDARRGLRVNEEEVLLRGACIHHDNGPLGAATHRAAEYRRIRLLKEAGFNAIRSAHNPMSRHLLDACDELGMYVLDELADYWYVRKTAHDHSDRFRATWREDAAALIAKDRNRACVIMYAIGNEIPETALPEGIALTGEITGFFHDADPSRPVTVAINLFVNTLVSFGASPYGNGEAHDAEAQAPERSLASSTEANAMVNHIGRLMHLLSRLPRADKASRDAFAAVDVAGYNYGLARYRGDLRRHPDRVILGTETLPGDVAWAWRLVTENPAVIGDFVWAGWEYLGEAGVAVWVPGRRAGLSKPYPYVIAGPGMFDLTGRPDASLRLAQAAWGRLPAPVITVRPLDRSGQPYVRSAWRVTDAVESWSWAGCEGIHAELEVYAVEDEVELLLNGRSLGRRRTGRRHGYRARFRTPYEAGTLVAIGYRGGHEVSRAELTSARNEVRTTLRAESPTLFADGDDLAFVHIEQADASGAVEMLADERVDISVSGPAELIAFASAAPATEESFLTPAQRTYRGRALAILRSTGEAGIVRIAAHAEVSGSAEIELSAGIPDPSDDAPRQSAASAASVLSIGEIDG